MTPASFRLNLVEGSVAFSFSPDAARELQAAVQGLMERMRAIAATQGSAAGRPTPQESLDYHHTGDVFLEVFCNPNIWPSPFAAKVLVTVRDDRIRLSTEAELPRLLEDLTLYLEQHG
ncbi:MAG: hypothetical protein AAFY26_21460 [Cyanobacteria bacterium J06638_22]